MRTRNAVCIVAAVAMMLLAVNAFGAAVFQDNFNSENGGVAQLNYSTFTNWTVQDGTVDLIGAGSAWDFLPGNGLYVDMDGSTGDAGTMVSTSISLAPGTYQLSFDLAGNQRGGSDTVVAEILLGPIWSQTITLSSSDPFSTYTHVFSVGSATTVTLSFAASGGDNIGMLLDDVAVTAIPLPVSAWGGLVLLGGLAAIRRKRS